LLKGGGEDQATKCDQIEVQTKREYVAPKLQTNNRISEEEYTNLDQEQLQGNKPNSFIPQQFQRLDFGFPASQPKIDTVTPKINVKEMGKKFQNVQPMGNPIQRSVPNLNNQWVDDDEIYSEL
jgi:hypothetical protein